MKAKPKGWKKLEQAANHILYAHRLLPEHELLAALRERVEVKGTRDIQYWVYTKYSDTGWALEARLFSYDSAQAMLGFIRCHWLTSHRAVMVMALPDRLSMDVHSINTWKQGIDAETGKPAFPRLAERTVAA